mmetsp:Transcript_126678/g.354617  ORF Transcript_126678/g.354617 Transcript_126678/m.354617 type:complete len:281 (+) Transcript_126678:101-943(+)
MGGPSEGPEDLGSARRRRGVLLQCARDAERNGGEARDGDQRRHCGAPRPGAAVRGRAVEPTEEDVRNCYGEDTYGREGALHEALLVVAHEVALDGRNDGELQEQRPEKDEIQNGHLPHVPASGEQQREDNRHGEATTKGIDIAKTLGQRLQHVRHGHKGGGAGTKGEDARLALLHPEVSGQDRRSHHTEAGHAEAGEHEDDGHPGDEGVPCEDRQRLLRRGCEAERLAVLELARPQRLRENCHHENQLRGAGDAGDADGDLRRQQGDQEHGRSADDEDNG